MANQTTWNRRYREYVQNINSGEPLKIASVLRELELFNIRKPLSFGESKMHTKALELVVVLAARAIATARGDAVGEASVGLTVVAIIAGLLTRLNMPVPAGGQGAVA